MAASGSQICPDLPFFPKTRQSDHPPHAPSGSHTSCQSCDPSWLNAFANDVDLYRAENGEALMHYERQESQLLDPRRSPLKLWQLNVAVQGRPVLK